LNQEVNSGSPSMGTPKMNLRRFKSGVYLGLHLFMNWMSLFKRLSWIGKDEWEL